jgi:tetratricopeptide (TPR) repeat protein
MLDRGPPEQFRRQYAERALPLLEAAVGRDDEDVPAREARGDALWALGRQEKALSDYETILASRPDAETTLARAGDLLLELNRPAKARAHLGRLRDLAPGRWHHHHKMAVAAFRLGDWDQAIRACRESLRLEPFNPAPRSLLIQCYLAAGYRDRAAAEYETLRHLTPAGRRQDLQRWYDTAQRRIAQ